MEAEVAGCLSSASFNLSFIISRDVYLKFEILFHGRSVYWIYLGGKFLIKSSDAMRENDRGFIIVWRSMK